VFVAIVLVINVMGQFQVPKYGKVSPEEMALSLYSKDSTAEAIFLFDVGNSSIFYSGNYEAWKLSFERHGRIKILTKEGLDWANIEIPLYSGAGKSEVIADFDACVFNLENGKILKSKVSNSDFITEEVSKGYTKRKIAIPNCKVGTVIDFKYTISSDYLFNFNSWIFQRDIPVKYSEYTATIPEYFDYNTVSSGFEPISITDGGPHNEKVTATHREIDPGLGGGGLEKYEYEVNYVTLSKTYVAQDVSAINNKERFVDNIYNYQTRLDFELASVAFPRSEVQKFSTTWEKVVEKLLVSEDFGKQLDGGGYLDDVLAAIPKGSSPDEIIGNVFGFIKSSIKWNNRSRLYVEDGVRKAFKNGVGNSAEVNLNLVMALRKAGVSAFPVAISTRSNGLINPSRPTLTGFNHVIALAVVGDQYYLLDATSRNFSLSNLPFQDLNGNGRIVDSGQNRWISLEPSFVSRMKSVGSYTVSDDGTTAGQLKQLYNDYYTSLFYIRYGENDYSTKYEDMVKKEYHTESLDSLQISFSEKGSPSITISSLVKPDGVASLSGNLMYLNPCVGFGNNVNPFVAVERKYPVNYAMPQEESYMNMFEIPVGYLVEELPQPLAIALPNNGGKYTYNCSLVGSRLMVVSKLTIPKSVYFAEEYPFLKTFYDQIVAKQSQQVILKKQ